MSPAVRTIAEQLASDLRGAVGDRLLGMVVFGRHALGDTQAAPSDADPVHTLAVIVDLGFSDLEALARRRSRWRRAGLATPVLIKRAELARSLDAFPIELGAVISRYEVVAGSDPFAGSRVDPADLRRACEVQVRSHLLHLREGYLETDGVPASIARLVARSAAPLLTLLTDLALLAGERGLSHTALAGWAARRTGEPDAIFADVLALAALDNGDSIDSARLFPRYLSAVERLAAYVDSWREEPATG
jgi:hypothetical protein